MPKAQTPEEAAAKAAAKLAKAAAAAEPIGEAVSDQPSIDGPGVKCDRAPIGSDADRMLRALAAQPKVRTRIPREAKEPVDAVASPVMNGLRINIRKGVSVELPEQVAALLEDSYYQTEKAYTETMTTNPFTGVKSNARWDLKSDKDQAALS